MRNFGEDILDYKELAEIVEEYKVEKALHDLDDAEELNCSKLARLFLYFKNGHFKMKEKIREN